MELDHPKQTHPSGREWLPEENESRAAILGSASRTQGVRRQGGGGVAGERKRQKIAGGGAAGAEAAGAAEDENGGGGGGGGGGAKKPTGRTLKVTGRGGASAAPRIVLPTADGRFIDGADEEDISPMEVRHKLFESPEQAVVHFEGRREEGDEEADSLGRDGGVRDQRRRALEASAAEDPEQVLPPSDAAEACRMLVGGEIASETFDVDAFLPLAAATMGSLSQMNSPIGDGKQPSRPHTGGGAHAAMLGGAPPSASKHGGDAPRHAAQDSFDPELDSSLSPILTPSLRHQLRALMASKSPTPRATGSNQAAAAAAAALAAAVQTPRAAAAQTPRADATAAPSSAPALQRLRRAAARAVERVDAPRVRAVRRVVDPQLHHLLRRHHRRLSRRARPHPPQPRPKPRRQRRRWPSRPRTPPRRPRRSRRPRRRRRRRLEARGVAMVRARRGVCIDACGACAWRACVRVGAGAAPSRAPTPVRPGATLRFCGGQHAAERVGRRLVLGGSNNAAGWWTAGHHGGARLLCGAKPPQ